MAMDCSDYMEFASVRIRWDDFSENVNNGVTTAIFPSWQQWMLSTVGTLRRKTLSLNRIGDFQTNSVPIRWTSDTRSRWQYFSGLESRIAKPCGVFRSYSIYQLLRR